MRTLAPLELERARVREGPYGSEPGKMHGAFLLVRNMVELLIVSSGPDMKHRWEHVSVSIEDRCPTWEEMSFIKDLFWMEEECVVQYHPPRSQYINCHPNVLHLWRPLAAIMPMPPLKLV